jgi:saccharopine dehydrogenase-like NADP-dependent oxidoreductase
MEEKTCRYPGYRDKIILLRESGFLDPEPVRLNGVSVSPRDLTAKLLMKAMRPEDEDLTVFRASVEGLDDRGEPVEQTWEMVDRYDRQTRTSSMARTTGYTCTAGVRLLAGGIWTEPGVAPPELVGRDRASYAFVIQELEQRGVVFKRTN